MIAVRSLLFNIAFYVATIVMVFVGLPVLFGRPPTVRAYASLWARVVMALLRAICGVTVEVRGLENLPAGGCIVASKHQSVLDILSLIPLLPRFVFVMKRELMFIPLFGQYLLRAGMIPIDRAKGRAVMGDLSGRVHDAVGAGLQLIIFPEGTRRPPGAEPQYKTGVSHLYAGANAPCVPVALNSGLFWPRRGFLRRPGRLVLDILPPIPPGRPRNEMLSELQARIEAASTALLREERGATGASASVSAAP